MKRNIKRMLTLLLAAAMMLATLAACGSESTDSDAVGSKKGKVQKTTEATTARTAETSGSKTSKTDLSSDFDKLDNVAYVMIYNPAMYDENKSTNKKLSTGKLSQWIDTNVTRADELDTESEVEYYNQLDDLGVLSEMEINTEGDRAGKLAATYKVGDKHSFYCQADLSSGKNSAEEFKCIYEGDKCYVWVVTSKKIDEDSAEKLAKEFDDKIFQADVDAFGKPRFAGKDGKVCLLFHPMRGGLLGYCTLLDMFSSSEVTDLEAKTYGANRDNAIVHINSNFFGKVDDDLIYSTVAHEFQHQICFTDFVEGNTATPLNTWLNEAMSGYAEEMLYTGIKESSGDIRMFNKSKTIRGGQSLYNFQNDGKDIGVYGSVYLFSEYLKNLSGEKVFTDIHSYWRTSYSKTLTTAQDLYKSVPEKVVKKIDGTVSYPSSFKFDSKEAQWMSKLTLDFYLSLMKYETEDPEAYSNVKVESLLYDEVNAAKLEGGGRIIFATKDGKFQIPSDAEKSLVYVGFDKDFNQITDIICK